MLIPFYNLFTSFKIMFDYSQYLNRVLLELKTLGIIEEMTEFEDTIQEISEKDIHNGVDLKNRKFKIITRFECIVVYLRIL